MLFIVIVIIIIIISSSSISIFIKSCENATYTQIKNSFYTTYVL